MKIALLIQRFPGGGAENYVEEIAKRLHQKGENVTVITSGNNSDDSKYGFKIIRLPSVLKLGEYNIWKGLEKVLRQEKFDVIHTNTYGYYHSDKVARLKKKLGYKLVMTSHGFTGMDLHKLKKEKIISQNSPFDFLRELYDEKIGKKTLLLCDHLIALSQYDYDFYKKIGVDESKISIIPPGISDVFFEPSKKQTIDGDPILLSVGALSWNKNHSMMIKAIPKLLEKKPNTKLVLIGPDGGEEKNLRKISKELDVANHILFLGPQSQWVVRDYMLSADIFLQTSYAEGLSTVLIEAMALGLPFITTHTGGNPFLCNMESRKVIPFNEQNILIQEILEIIDAQSNGKNYSRTEQAQNYSWKNIFQKISKLYEKLL